jgi:hypothetical protein
MSAREMMFHVFRLLQKTIAKCWLSLQALASREKNLAPTLQQLNNIMPSDASEETIMQANCQVFFACSISFF